MSTALQDLRYAARALVRAPSFALTAVLTLALAIAVNTVMFTVLHSLVWRPMPVRDANAVVRIFPIDGSGQRQNLLSDDDYRHYAAAASGLSGVAAYIPLEVTAAEGDSVREALAYSVSSSYFPMLGFQLSRGRGFSTAEEQDSAARVVVIGHRLWSRLFGASDSALGRHVNINGHSFTVIGVGPAKFTGTEPLEPDFWVPLAARGVLASAVPPRDDRHTASLLVIGRLAPEARIPAVEHSLSAVAAGLAVADGHRSENRPRSVTVVPATFFHGGAELRPVIVLVLGAVALVLITACANIANLVLTRATARAKELAVRIALGAGRVRIARFLMAESLLIAVAGGVAGLLLSAWTLRLLYPVGVSLFPLQWARIVLDLTPDLTIFLYTAALAAAAAVGFGLAPLLSFSADALAHGLRGHTGMSGMRVRGPWIRRTLIVVQVAVCVMLLAGSATATRALQRTRVLDLGFTAAGVVHTSADLVRHGYSAAAAANLLQRLAARASAYPGVRDVAFTTHVPLTGGVRRVRVQVEGHDPAAPTLCTHTAVSPGYFRTLRIPVIAGRDFSTEEVSAAEPVAIISDALARRFWPGQSAIGRRVQAGDGSMPLTIVGVVRDASDGAIWREKEISLYVPATAATAARLRLLVRTDDDARTLAAFLEAEAHRSDPRLRFDAAPLEEVLALWILPSRVVAVIASILGAIALAIAAVGIYGVMAYAVSQRRREIGVRIALGADRGDVRRLVLADGAWLVGAGLAVGLAAASSVARGVASVLPGAAGVDPVALGAAASILMVTALSACYLPVRSAVETDPVVALKNE